MVNEPHLTETELAQFVDGALSGLARVRALEHLDRCEGCRREVVTVGRVVAEEPRAPGRIPSRATRPLVLIGALAAALASLWVLPRLDRPDPTATIRGPGPAEDIARIQVISPPEGEFAARFTWRGNGADGYRVVILSEDGAPVWSGESSDTTISVPVEAGLQPGVAYFWRVDAVTEGVTASSGPRALRLIAPR